MAGVSPLPKYKLVFLGDESVGKTIIITRYIYGRFDRIYQATIGIDFLCKTVYLEDITIRLQLWDTSGHERFRSVFPSYIKDSSVAVIFYDVTNRQSFLNTSMWIEQVRTERGSDAMIFLVGTKTDLVDKRKVQKEEGEGKARDFGAIFVEISAKDELKVKWLFKSIASDIREKYAPPDNNLSERDPSNLGDLQPLPHDDQPTTPNQILPDQPQDNKSRARVEFIWNSSMEGHVSPPIDFKVLFLGDESVGKSSIITKFMHDKFDPTYQATIGVNFVYKTMHLKGASIRLQFWDIAGKQRCRNEDLNDSIYAVIVYDVANRQSFLNTSKYWIEEVRAVRGSDVTIILVGNKTDLADKRQVSIEEGDNKARESGAMFVETSAKSGFNIEVVFSWIASNEREYWQTHNNSSSRNQPNLGYHKQEPREYQLTPQQPQEQDLRPQHSHIALPAPQAGSSSKTLEEIVKNLAIVQQQYQQETNVSLQNLEKTIGKLVASVGKLKTK